MPYYPPVSMEIGETVTSGTAGSVLFVGTGPVLAQDNANLFWDDTNNRLGIGTASPTFTLEAKNASTGNIIKAFDSNGVNVTAASDASGRAFLSATGVNLGGGQGGAYFTASGYQEAWFNVECTSNTSGQRYVRFGNYANVFSIQLLTDSAAAIARTPFSLYNSAPTDSLVITATGLVGINSPGAQAQLHVTSSSSSYVGLNVQGAASQAQAFAAITDSSGNVLVNITANSGALGGVVINEQGSDADVRIEGDTDADLLHTDASTDRVGVGVAAPGSKLDVAGSFQCDSITNDTGLAAGVYTPTLTNVANLDASTAYECQYMRVGNTVTVSGKVDIDPTLTATSTQLGISLPVASNIGATEDCAGVAFASGIVGQGAAILGDAANNRAQLQYISGDVTNQPMYFTFTYQVI